MSLPAPTSRGDETAHPTPSILHVLTTLHRGGTEELVYRLAREQARLGSQVEIAALRSDAPLAGRFEQAGLRVHLLGLKRSLDLGAFRRLRRLIRDGAFQVVHSHLDLADLYVPFAARGRAAVVSTRHNTDDWRSRRTWKRWPFLIWERAAHRRADASIAVSAAVRDFLAREEGLDPSAFSIIPNGIDLEPFASPPSPAAARLLLAQALAAYPHAPGGEDGERVVVGFVGRLARQKGVDILLEATARLPGIDLVLVGDGPEREALAGRARRPDLAGRVFFAGHREDVAALLPALDIVAVPSRWEGFGLAAVEAMAAGRPVVASAVDGLREVVEDGRSGRLVPPEDPLALAEALGGLAVHADARSRLGTSARSRAFRCFGAERMAREVMEVYAGVLGSGEPASVRALAEKQIHEMWSGVFPRRLLQKGAAHFLSEQSREYRAVLDHLEMHQPVRGRRLLDLGCGLGTLLVQASRRGAWVAGIEPDHASLALTRHRLEAEQIQGRLLAAVGEGLPVADGCFDLVTCCSVLEHVQQPERVVKEIRRVLKPGGVLYLGVPNALQFREGHYKVFLPPHTPRFLARLWLRLRGRDPRFLDSVREILPLRVRALLAAAGFEEVEDPVRRRLQRLERTLAGEAPARLAGRVVVTLARVSGTGFILRRLVRRGFFVHGAFVARRPQPGGGR